MTDNWRHELSQAFTDMPSLCRYLQIDPNELPALESFKPFPLKVPREFATRMRVGDPLDPLFKQVYLSALELNDTPGYTQDPVGDLNALTVPGLVHKYQGRVLLITTGACAIHCRYCFRRHFPYNDNISGGQNLQPALAYIASRPDIHEVILSGGDPLLLSDEKLLRLLDRLNQIPHLRRIRLHSRTPVVLPSRVTSELLTGFAASAKPLIMVIHANHPNELNAAVAQACHLLKQSGVSLLNQSVLLQGVNDNSSSLCQLSERLQDCGVLPYYLHTLDKASGTAHFAVSNQHAAMLMENLRTNLPGYLIPRLVMEQAGKAYKTPL